MGPPDRPQHGSWLNGAGMEVSALSRQCLGRRVAGAGEWVAESAAGGQARHAARVAAARKKLHWIYPS